MDASNQAPPRPPIVIVPYRPSWADEFAALAHGLRDALGPLALRIDHIGSTSVPGLAAKDIVDIQVTVQALEGPVGRALEKGGYRRREPISSDHVPPGQPETEIEWAKWLYRPAAGQRSANIHIRVSGRLNQRYPLLFRDYLRAHPSTAESYALVKVALAKYHADDVEAYYDVKDPVCDIIHYGRGRGVGSCHPLATRARYSVNSLALPGGNTRLEETEPDERGPFISSRP